MRREVNVAIGNVSTLLEPGSTDFLLWTLRVSPSSEPVPNEMEPYPSREYEASVGQRRSVV